MLTSILQRQIDINSSLITKLHAICLSYKKYIKYRLKLNLDIKREVNQLKTAKIKIANLEKQQRFLKKAICKNIRLNNLLDSLS